MPRAPAARRRLALLAMRMAAVLAGLRAGAAAAQERPDTAATVGLKAVVVSVPAAASVVGGASAIVANADSLALPAAPTLAQALRRIPFVGVRENSRGEVELSVRGSESRQVAVVMDGVPISLTWDGRADPSLVPAAGRLVLVRGLASLLHGPNTLGGVVQVRSPIGGAPPTLRMGADHAGGVSASGQAGVSTAVRGGRLSLSSSAGVRRRPGQPLPSPVSDSGAAGGLRANSDFEQAQAYVGARAEGGAGAWAGASLSVLRGSRGVPPELHLREPRLWRYPATSRSLLALSAGGPATWPARVEASVGVDAAATELEQYGDLSYDAVEARERWRDGTVTLRTTAEHAAGAHATLRYAFTHADIRHRERVDDDPFARYRQRLWSLGAEGEVALGAVQLSGGAVMDAADTPESGDKPALRPLRAAGMRAGVSARPGGSVRLHASVSSRARIPSLRELYSGSLGRFEPNPGLRPERLLGAEAGLTAAVGPVEVQGVAFRHDLSDAIVRTAVGDGRFRRENRDRMQSTGVELLATTRHRALALSADLMLQRVHIHGPTAPQGQRRPENIPSARAGLDARLDLPWNLRAQSRALYVGAQWCLHAEEERMVRLKDGTRVDGGVEREWRRGRGLAGRIRLTLDVENATDAALYDQCGLPQPGRTLRMGIELG
ncbi:MAG TPA: TonB-dependent receptor [Longimicrobium sp.]